ncbi:tautomerase family protein [Burkholderia cenocepacia]|uniref:tautomerase family protein n=1 Tax=Burkholderia cenocepacia TaxID=95486 RepID=UPI00215B63C8|nr:4-oxalocrotonate tautomerase family protein [Burkholderia cenocepacia]
MPHIIVKAWPGKTEEQKQRLADAITRDVMTILGYGQSPCQSASRKFPRIGGRKKSIVRISRRVPQRCTKNRATGCKRASQARRL